MDYCNSGIGYLVNVFREGIRESNSNCYLYSISVMAQVFANKLVMFGGFVVPAAVIVYGVSFLVTDVLCEFHSKNDARTAVIGGFIGSVLLVFGIRVMLAWDYPVFWKGQQAMETALGLTWRIVLGSVVSFMVSQNFDFYLYDKIRLN